MTNKLPNTKFFSQIVDLLQSARNNVVRTINQTMVTTYFEIGKMIVEEEMMREMVEMQQEMQNLEIDESYW